MVVVLILVLVAALSGAWAEPATAKTAPEVTRLVAFGHSWVAGRYPDPQVTPWPDRVAEKHGVAFDNFGVGASEAAQTLESVRAYSPRATDEVVVEAMLNDVRRYGSPGIPAFRRTVRAMLVHLTAGAARPARIVMVIDAPIVRWQTPPGHGYDQGSNATLRAYGVTLRAVVSRFAQHRVRTVDLARRWDPSRHIAGDGIHPSEAGTARIAERIAWAASDRKP